MSDPMAQMELVNGYRCYNCTDVDYAKRNIDPAHPKDGPYGVKGTDKAKGADPFGAAVVLGGSLTQPTSSTGAPAPEPAKASPQDGQRLNLTV